MRYVAAWLVKQSRYRQGHAVVFYLPPFLFSIVTLILLLAATWVVMWPSDGIAWVFPQGRISSVDPGRPGAKAGLQPDDILLAVNGHGVANGPLYARYRAGQAVVLTIRRGASVQDVALTLAEPSATDLLWRLIPVIVGFSFWGTGVGLFVIRPTFAACRVFFLMGQAAAIVLSFGQLSAVNVVWTVHLFHLSLLALPPLLAGLYVTLIAPTTRLARAAPRWMAAFSLVLAAPEVVTCLLGGRDHLLVPFFTSGPDWSTGLRLYLGITLGVLTLGLIYTYYSSTSAELRRRLRGLAFGTLVGFAPLIFLSLLPEVVWGRGTGVPYQATFPFLTLVPLSHAYVIVEHDLGPLDRFFHRSLVVFTLGLMWVVLYLGGVGLGMILFHDTPLVQPVVGALATMGLAIVFTPVRDRIQQAVDHLFYGGWYDYHTVIAEASHVLSTATTRQALGERLVKVVVEGLRVEGASLYLWDAHGQMALEGNLWLDATDRISEEEIKPWVDRKLPATPIRLAGKAEQRLAWVLPLVNEGKSVGVLFLGKKREDDFFEPADEQILSTLGEQAALAAANMLLLDDLRRTLAAMEKAQRQLLTAREEERRILAWELHDGPVQDLLALGYQLSECRDRAWLHEAELAETLEESRRKATRIMAVVRDACTQLRSDVLDVMGLGPAMKQYAYQLMQKTGIAVYLDVPDYGPRLVDPLGITLLRVFQEGLNNAVEHAGVNEVWTSFVLEDGGYELKIWDKGQGFAMPERLDVMALTGHLGLVTMEERVAAANGHLAVYSMPGEGTEIRVWGKVSDSGQVDHAACRQEAMQ